MLAYRSRGHTGLVVEINGMVFGAAGGGFVCGETPAEGHEVFGLYREPVFPWVGPVNCIDQDI